jgi:hypothetical protein
VRLDERHHTQGASVSKHGRRRSGADGDLGRVGTLLAGLVMLVLSLPPFFTFPLVSFWLLPLAAVYLFLLYILPRLWLFVLPLVTVGLDITPWTGRFSYNELDFVFLLTISSGLLYNRYRFRVFAPTTAMLVFLAYVIVIFLGYNGLTHFILPPQSSFDNPYYSSEYAYKVVKGLVWGVSLVPMWGYLLAVDKQRAVNALVIGMCLAALLLGIIVLWERGPLSMLLSDSVGYQVANTLPGPSSSYRVTGVFSDMHTGGAAIDGVLLLLLPTCLYGAVYGRPAWIRLLGAAGFLALAYVSLVSFTWETQAAFALALAAYSALTLWSRHLAGIRFPVHVDRLSVINRLFLLAGIVALTMLLAFTLGGRQINGRSTGVNAEAENWQDHWSNVVGSANSGLWSQLIGNGMGSFPGRYIKAHPHKVNDVGSFRVVPEQHRSILQLGGGRGLSIGQRVSTDPNTTYSINVTLRADAAGRLDIALCERNLIFASNGQAQCVSGSVHFEATDGAFEQQILEINSGRVGEERATGRWPTVLTLHYHNVSTLLEIDAITLSVDGLYILRNSSFIQGLDYWFHYDDFFQLPWHVNNALLQVWFETGWLGLCLFLALLTLLIKSNFKRHAHDSLMPVYTSGVIALCLFGMFGSPLDSARVSWMFYFFLVAGLASLRVRKKARIGEASRERGGTRAHRANKRTESHAPVQKG